MLVIINYLVIDPLVEWLEETVRLTVAWSLSASQLVSKASYGWLSFPVVALYKHCSTLSTRDADVDDADNDVLTWDSSL